MTSSVNGINLAISSNGSTHCCLVVGGGLLDFERWFKTFFKETVTSEVCDSALIVNLSVKGILVESEKFP